MKKSKIVSIAKRDVEDNAGACSVEYKEAWLWAKYSHYLSIFECYLIACGKDQDIKGE